MKSARAIVIKGDAEHRSLLVMYRNKLGKEYYTLVGGGVEPGEEPEQALLRELAEETSIQIANPRLVFVEEAKEAFGTQYVYLCDYVAGEPVLSETSYEAYLNTLGQNIYKPLWLPLEKLADTEFLSEGLKHRMLKAMVQGGVWPTEPEYFHHTQKNLSEKSE